MKVFNSMKDTITNTWNGMVKNRKIAYLVLALILALPPFFRWVM